MPALLLLLLAPWPALAGCALAPSDPFVAAERALRRDDLLGALRAYDTVPVAHPRYPDARAAAVEIELRMRRCQELILEALLLRGEWRDRDALATLQRAREQWPTAPSLQAWVDATERRLALFGSRQHGSSPAAKVTAGATPVPLLAAHALVVVAAPPAADDAPADEPAPPAQRPPHAEADGSFAPEAGDRAAPPAAPGGETAASRADLAPARGAAAAGEAARAPAAKGSPGPGQDPAPAIALGEDPVASGLVAVEARLGGGDLAAAVGELIELSSRFPDDARVRVRLGRLLHQRALLAYGQGSLAAAIADWQRVLEIEPQNRSVAQMLERARAELAAAGAGN